MVIKLIAFMLAATPPSSDEILLHLTERDTQFYQNTPALVANWLLWGWQHILSPQMGPRCRFRPSCSEYARQVISRYGLAKGMVMAAGRLLRDTGFAERDYPVDEEGWWLDSPSSHW
jgi:putative component of membrane protein insertase Oxa1/YidC/SpoIIIJ protein YidD